MIRAIDERLDDDAYERIALADDDRHWELWDGVLVEKPGMSTEHNHLMFELGYQHRDQLDPEQFRVRVGAGRLRKPHSFYIPDAVVIPTPLERASRGKPRSLEAYTDPLPFVAEVWSPSTGRYDIDKKLPEYMARGDLEIWRVHPFERRVNAWRRQADGNYVELVFLGGSVEIPSLPGVAVDLDALFSE
jgi:Uma2 family endonuclease